MCRKGELDFGEFRVGAEHGKRVVKFFLFGLLNRLLRGVGKFSVCSWALIVPGRHHILVVSRR